MPARVRVMHVPSWKAVAAPMLSCVGLRAQFRLRGGLVCVSEGVREELEQWVTELRREDHDGVPLARVGDMPAWGEIGTGALYADASGEWGFGAWALVGKELLLVVGRWSEQQRDGWLICEKELHASTVGLRMLGPLLEAELIFEFTDSTVALAAMLTLTPTSEVMQQLIQERLVLAEYHGWRLTARRISSKNNLWADLASRGHADEVVRQAAAMGLRTRILQA